MLDIVLMLMRRQAAGMATGLLYLVPAAIAGGVPFGITCGVVAAWAKFGKRVGLATLLVGLMGIWGYCSVIAAVFWNYGQHSPFLEVLFTILWGTIVWGAVSVFLLLKYWPQNVENAIARITSGK